MITATIGKARETIINANVVSVFLGSVQLYGLPDDNNYDYWIGLFDDYQSVEEKKANTVYITIG